MVAVTVDLSNPVSGFKRSTTTDAAGKFVFRNLPPNSYHVQVSAQGFAAVRDATSTSEAPCRSTWTVTLTLAGDDRVGPGGRPRGGSLERDPTAHTDIDQSLIAKLPLESRRSG